MNFIFAKTFLKKYYYYSWASALLSWVVFSFQTTLISLWDQWYTIVEVIHTHTSWSSSSLTHWLIYGLAGLLLVLVVELVKISSYINWSICVLDQQSLWISLQSWVNFGAFQVQWINREGQISKTKLMQIVMGLCYSTWCWMMRKDWSDYALLTQGN